MEVMVVANPGGGGADLIVKVLSVGDDVVLKLSGELDAVTVRSLQAALESCRSVTTAARVTLDMREVKFLGTAALRVIVDGARCLAAEHRTLMIIDPSRSVCRTLEVAMRADLFPDISSLVRFPASA